MSFLAIHGEEVCSALLEEEVDKDSSGLWGGESQTPPKETSVERETPPSSDTPHVVKIPPSNSSTTNRDPASSGKACSMHIIIIIQFCVLFSYTWRRGVFSSS